MVRFAWKTQALAALLLLVGSGTLTAGVFDFWKSSAKSNAKDSRRVVARGQEPNPAPPAPLDVAPDPAYSSPAVPAMPMTPAPAQPLPMPSQPGCTDCAPQYSGFSGCNTGGHACNGCRESTSCFGYNAVKSSRRMHGDSYYCDCYPLFGPRYGYYDTCWRRLPEDCRCPILLPPRKSPSVPDSIPTETSPSEETTPAPPQVFNFR